MRKIIVKAKNTLLVILISISSLNANDVKDDFLNCTTLKSRVSRLMCFDAIAKKYMLEDEKKKIVKTNKNSWKTTIDIDKVNLTLDACKGCGKWKKPIKLNIQCVNNRTKLSIKWQDDLDKNAIVKVKLDDKKYTNNRWKLSRDKEETIFPRYNVAFIKKLLKSQKLFVETTTYNKNKTTAIFQLANLNEALTPIRNSCNW